LYPDLIVTCSLEDREAERILRHPVVIIEILSPSSFDYDRRTKLKLYQRLPSLQHYVLVTQDYCWVECLTREPSGKAPTEDKWTLQAFELLTDRLPLPAIGIEVPLAELYAGIQIEQGPYLRKESN
jgi:Uma2 family endonuclease